MTETLIKPEDWPPFCECFTRKHRGWLVTLSKEERPDTETQHGTAKAEPAAIFDKVPLRAVTARQENGNASLSFVVGDKENPEVHTVEKPVLLRLEQTSEGADSGLTVRTGEGEVFRTQFLTPHYRRACRPRRNHSAGTGAGRPDRGESVGRATADDEARP